jgi:predicted small secreted protein
MKSKFFMVLGFLLVSGFLLTVCDTTTGAGSGDGGGFNWSGDYWTEGDHNGEHLSGDKATLDLTAKTLTANFYESPGNNFSLTDVSIGEVSRHSWNEMYSGDLVVDWAYVYNGSTKIGVIYKRSRTGDGKTFTYHGLCIGDKYGYYLGLGEALGKMDLSDVDTTYSFDGRKK